MSTRITALGLMLSLMTSCGDASYSSSGPENPKGKTGAANAEGVGKNNKTTATGEGVGNKIAAAGMSLDLYAIVDISGSLNRTDRNCTRFEALKTFFKELKTTLGENPDARLSLTVFSSQATFVGTDDSFLKLSDAELDAKYRSTICLSNGDTNISKAFTMTKDVAENLIRTSPKKVSSVLIFTDGMPTDMPQPIDAAALLRSVFPDRVFGVLLGDVSVNGMPSSGGVVIVSGGVVISGPSTGSGGPITSPEKFMNEVTARVLKTGYSTDVNGSSREFTQSSGSLSGVFVLALVFIFLVLAA
ncbi:VWA domain-containing protein, partial [bacterium]|nr:VWA domain-containing protein [bacterium]